MKRIFLLLFGILIFLPIAIADNAVEIRPNPATDNDNLVCNVLVNINSVLQYTWFKNSVEQNINVKTITADKTAVGNVWKCVVEAEYAGFGTFAIGEDSVTIQADASSNTPPNAEIREPADGSRFYETEKITFWGVAKDAEDGLLNGNMLKWYADDNQELGSGNTIDVEASKLSVGTHIIKLVATDSKGLADTAQITITVGTLDIPPGSVEIVPKPAYDNDNLRCISNFNIDGAIFHYTWFKNGVNQNLDAATATHDLTSIADNWKCAVQAEYAGIDLPINIGEDSVTISNRAPVASFDYSPNYLDVSFTSTSSDPDESDRIVSSVWEFGDGQTGTEQNPTHKYAAAGTYTVKLTVTDSHSGIGTYTTQVTVSAETVIQSIVVTPADNTISYIESLQYTATGHYSDGSTKVITNDAQWSSSDLNVAAIGNGFVTAIGLANAGAIGQTTITATLNGISGSTNLYVINFAPTAIIVSPQNSAVFNTGATITFDGTATDYEDSALSGNSLVWTEGNVELGRGNSFSKVLPQGTHTITLTATDSKGNIDTATVAITVNAVAPPIIDTDKDGIADSQDNCPLTANPDQKDSDHDGIGDVCDNCPNNANPDQRDSNGNGIGDVCEIAPPVNHPPVLNSIGNKQVNENQLLTFTISATDPDGDSLTYSASGLPAGASFSGTKFSWTPTYEQSGSYSVTFTVSDGHSGTATETITITVGNVAIAPLIRSVSANDAYVGDDLTISAEVISRDGGIARVWAKIWQGQELLKVINLTHGSGNAWSKTITVTEDLAGATSFTVYAVDNSGVEAQPVTELLDVKEAELDTYIGRISYEEYPKSGSEQWFDITIENPGTVDWENAKLILNIQDLGIRATKSFDLEAGEKVTKSIMVELPEGAEGQFDVRITLSNEDIYRVKYRLINIK